MIRATLLACLMIRTGALTAAADPAVVEAVEARKDASGWTFSVTLRHSDTGWDEYADGWRIVAPDGRVLATRELVHPHVAEQPFTRSLGNIDIPDGLSQILVQTSTSTEGWADGGTVVSLPR